MTFDNLIFRAYCFPCKHWTCGNCTWQEEGSKSGSDNATVECALSLSPALWSGNSRPTVPSDIKGTGKGDAWVYYGNKGWLTERYILLGIL